MIESRSVRCIFGVVITVYHCVSLCALCRIEKAVPHGQALHGARGPRGDGGGDIRGAARPDARTDTRIKRKAISSLRRGVLLHRSNDIRLEQENVRLSSA